MISDVEERKIVLTFEPTRGLKSTPGSILLTVNDGF